MKIKGDSKLIALLESALEKYPELQKFHFIIKFKKLNDAFASTGKIGNIIRISVDEEIKEQDDSIILGAIVSELTHYVIDNTSNSSMIKLFFKYTFGQMLEASCLVIKLKIFLAPIRSALSWMQELQNSVDGSLSK